MLDTVQIHRISPADAPWDLLLLADPERRQAEKYMYAGDCSAAVQGGRTVGVLVLLATEPNTLEIMNIAVGEDLQDQGIGKRLIAEGAKIAIQKKDDTA